MKAAKYSALVILSILALTGFLIKAFLTTELSYLGSLKNDSLDGMSAVEQRSLARPEHPVISPSGKYQLQIKEGIDGEARVNRFCIAKIEKDGQKPKVVYCSKDDFATRFKLYFLWDDSDRVWVYSSDIGTFYWARVTDDLWEKHVHGDNDIPPPAIIQREHDWMEDASKSTSGSTADRRK